MGNAQELLAKALAPGMMKAGEREALIRIETECSAAIEDEFNPKRLERQAGALERYMAAPLGPEAMFGMHRE